MCAFPVMEFDTTTEYWANFNELVSTIQVSLDNQLDISAEYLSSIKVAISSLQTYATSHTSILPKYDVRRSQEVRKQHKWVKT